MLMQYPLLVLTGANGFIGRHFIRQIKSSNIRIRALTRRIPNQSDSNPHNVEWVIGDINDPGVWHKLLEPDCLVVNLAYSQVTALDDALGTSRIMAEACSKIKISRLVHCSTLSVYGKTASGTIDELTPCTPINQYGRTKLEIDNILLENDDGYNLTILRPATVFGTGGLALQFMCDNLINKPHFLNYFRSSLFGYRRLHLVPVETVVAALQFLCESKKNISREIYILSEDEDPLNNYRDVEKIIMTYFGIPDYVIAPIPLPSILLKWLLKAKRSAEVDPNCHYSSYKLKNHGFVPPISLLAALRSFSEQYKEALLKKSQCEHIENI